jgi:hypothetical protein
MWILWRPAIASAQALQPTPHDRPATPALCDAQTKKARQDRPLDLTKAWEEDGLQRYNDRAKALRSLAVLRITLSPGAFPFAVVANEAYPGWWEQAQAGGWEKNTFETLFHYVDRCNSPET